jgi:hypothetical protein
VTDNTELLARLKRMDMATLLPYPSDFIPPDIEAALNFLAVAFKPKNKDNVVPYKGKVIHESK